MNIAIVATLLLMCAGVAGCATGGPRDVSGGEITDFEKAFQRGELRMTCDLACSGAWGMHLREAKGYYDSQLWDDLARITAKVGFRVDLSYLYLARSAEGKGHPEAAATYYRLAAATDYKCSGKLCDGINVPLESRLGLARVSGAMTASSPIAEPASTKAHETQQIALIAASKSLKASAAVADGTPALRDGLGRIDQTLNAASAAKAAASAEAAQASPTPESSSPQTIAFPGAVVAATQAPRPASASASPETSAGSPERTMQQLRDSAGQTGAAKSTGAKPLATSGGKLDIIGIRPEVSTEQDVRSKAIRLLEVHDGTRLTGVFEIGGMRLICRANFVDTTLDAFVCITGLEVGKISGEPGIDNARAHEVLRKGFTQKFGAPDFVDSIPVRNALGARFEKSRIEWWDDNKNMIQIESLGSKIDQGSLAILSGRSITAEMEAERERNRKRRF